MENLFTPFSHALQYALGWMVIHSLWQAMVIALFTGIILLVLRKKSAQVRYVVGNIALVAILVSAVSTFAYYYNSETEAREAVLTVDPGESTLVNAENTLAIPSEQAAQAEKTIIKVREEDQTLADSPLIGAGGFEMFKAYFNNNIPLILTIWVLGMALFLLKILGSISYVYFIRSRHNFSVDEYWLEKLDFLKAKLNLSKSIELVESALVRSPVVVGHLKPVILFPIGVINRLSPKDVEAILAHELAHIARHDYIFNILQSLVEALFYYHPAVWWLSAQVRNERESACDEIAIQLTGDSIHYAKTLVTVQEMAFFPLSTALAFAGQPKQSQFLLRIQRILKQKQNPNVMEKLIATFFIVGSLVVLTIAQNKDLAQNDNNNSHNITISENSFIQWGDAPLSMSGFWNAKIDGEDVKITFNHNVENGNWTSTRRFKKSEFSALPTTESAFSVSREAGTMNFKGKFEDNEGYGKFKFEESTDFKAYLGSYGMSNIKEEMMMHLFMSNINKAYMEYLKQNGYTSISKSQLQDLAIHGLTKENIESYITTFKKGANSNLPLERIVELKIHGVDAEYRQEMIAAGFVDVPLEQILEAKIHGLSGQYLKDIANTGQKLSLEEAIQMRIHGIDANFITKISKGKKDISPEEIVDAKIHGIDKIDVEQLQKAGVDPSNDDLKAFAIHGIDAEYVEKMNNAGFGKLSAEDILAAKIHGITPETARSFGEMGYKNLSFERVLEFKIHGITADYVKNMTASGYKDLSPSRIVEFKIHGITPEYVKSVNEMGFKDLSANRIVEMKIHGVTANFVKGFTDMGYKETPLSKYVELKIHGVTPDFIKGYKEMGFQEVSLSKAVEMKIHGVTPQYIKQMQEKGYKNLDLDEYIRLKIHGFGQSTGGARSFNNIQQNLNSLQESLQQPVIAGANGDKDSPFGTFMKLLVKDGLVQLNKKVIVKGNSSWLSIDGKKLADSQFQNYKKQVEAKIGELLNKKFRFGMEGVVFELKGDDIMMKGEFEINND